MKEEEKLVQAKGITKQNRKIKFIAGLTKISNQQQQGHHQIFRFIDIFIICR